MNDFQTPPLALGGKGFRARMPEAEPRGAMFLLRMCLWAIVPWGSKLWGYKGQWAGKSLGIFSFNLFKKLHILLRT